ncbi:MAG: DUF3108 domain-containing protein [Spirochaetes bacterium]|nr:DUF3108 domain-containing protein [Spirochaetota bacterium]
MIQKFLMVLLIVSFCSVSLYALEKAPVPFKVGEYMEFEVRVFNTSVAIQKVWVKGIVDIAGKKCFHIKADIETVKWVSKIYHLHDVVDEYIDVNTLFPYQIKTKIEEGSWTNTVQIDIDRDKKILRYRDSKKGKDKEMEYKGEVVGLISMLYYARTIKPKKNEKVTFVLSNGDKIETIDAIVEDTKSKLTIKKMKKKFQAFLYKQVGGRNVALWISNDDLRLPIRMISIRLKLAGYGITNIEAWLNEYKP